jgi:lipoprotein-anchoring transpeptidase ErfK/SrfK
LERSNDPKERKTTMRRHVENQIERPQESSFGILILFALWMLALAALSAAAHGQEASALEGSVRQAVQPANNSVAPNSVTPEPQSESDEQVLTRYILISIPDRRLALIDNGQVVRIYSIAVGAEHTPSPEGNFTIISHVADPTWTHEGKVVGPGKNNPVGSRWMGLSLKGYGIHGTNVPRSIGKAASHGCFRMKKKDIEELFTLVRVGDTVAVRGQRDELVSQVFDAGEQNGEVQVASAADASVAVAEEENRNR